METAKAVVEVPSPQDGVIAKLYGNAGDIIKTHSPLLAFEAEAEATDADAGTVVGNIQSSGETVEDNFIVGGSAKTKTSGRIKATPKVKALAKKRGIDLSTINGTGTNGAITLNDLNALAPAQSDLPEGFEQIKGVRRTMVQTMIASHKEVVPVTIFDDADISGWPEKEDITARLIQAICAAAKVEPSVNALYNSEHVARSASSKVHLGLATDTEDGLFVPVIRNAESLSKDQLRAEINRYKEEVGSRSVSPKDLTGSTITLSNFGKFAGRYATPIIVPPSVAILGVGRLRNKTLPLSLSFDHRAVTGGEATRFLGEVLKSLEA